MVYFRRDIAEICGGYALAQWLAVAMVVIPLFACTASATQEPPRVPPYLLDTALARGSVRVIVDLDVSDPGAIDATKQSLLANLAGTKFRVVRELEGLPALALGASAGTLCALEGSPLVKRVTEDRLMRRQR